MNDVKIPSGAKFGSEFNPIEIVNIGRPGDIPQLILYKGRIFIYNKDGQTIIDGGLISALAFNANSVTTEKLSIGGKKFFHNLVFTPIDIDTASWDAGQITFVDGTNIAINSGNTGNITQKTYIFFNNTATLQKTTTYSSAIGGNNIPIVVIEPVSDGKCIVSPFSAPGYSISGDSIVTGKIQSTDGQTYFDLNNNILLINDGTTNRIAIGKIGSSWGIKVSLPSYDCLTDTNLDHFALWSVADDTTDSILIKELLRGGANIAGNTENYTIPHNLGYVPFFLVYVYDNNSLYNNNKWKLLAHNSAGASVPSYIAVADTNNIYIYNYSPVATDFKWYIFYDNIVGSGGNTITESDEVLKISKQGKDVSSTDPNDFIFHSDLNTFKILKEGNGIINYTTDGNYTFSHGAGISNPTAYMLFIKFPDGKTILIPGKGVVYCYDGSMYVMDSYIDTSNIGMRIVGPNSARTLYYKYYIFETPL